MRFLGRGVVRFIGSFANENAVSARGDSALESGPASILIDTSGFEFKHGPLAPGFSRWQAERELGTSWTFDESVTASAYDQSARGALARPLDSSSFGPTHSIFQRFAGNGTLGAHQLAAGALFFGLDFVANGRGQAALAAEADGTGALIPTTNDHLARVTASKDATDETLDDSAVTTTGSSLAPAIVTRFADPWSDSATLGSGLAATNTLMSGGTISSDTFAGIFQMASDAQAETTGVIDGSGKLRLFGTDADDLLVGGGGDDTLLGMAGDDVLVGGDGNDHLDGGTGNDVMAGGRGNDTFVVDAAGDSVIEAPGAASEGGSDTIIVKLDSLAMFDLATTPGVENLIADGNTDFTGYGNDASNDIASGTGADTLLGKAGNDVLAGGDGNDHLDGGTGNDLMAGGLGNDTYVVDAAGDSVIEVPGAASDGGSDTIIVKLDSLAMFDLATTPGVENLIADGNTDFTGYGNDLSNQIYGGAGNDTLYGDWVYATQYGNQQSALAGELAADSAATAAAALDVLLGGSQEIITLLELPSSVAPQTSDLTPIAGEIIVGSKSKDTIVGSHGGNDIIDAGRGNDTITGGGGDDTLTGGLGNDTFIFRPGFGNDTITDFGNSGGDHDTIYLEAGMFGNLDEVAAHLEQVGNDVVFTVTENDHITFSNANKLNFSVNDQFVFI